MRRGFTLVELLGVIVIMSIILTIAIPSVIKIQSIIQNKMYCDKVKLLANSAKLYGRDIKEDLPSSNNPLTVNAGELAKTNYFKRDNSTSPFINDPRTGNENKYMDEVEFELYVKNNSVYVAYVDVDDMCNLKAEIIVDEEEDVNEPKLLTTAILNQGGGASVIEAKGNPNFNDVPSAETSGIYASVDDYGTTYYYRGQRDSLKNSLIFAGFQWKIIRINGDSSIRLIYNGTCSNNSCEINGAITSLGISSRSDWHPNALDQKYIGYMYGGADGEKSTSQEQAVTNETDSVIKEKVDEWYENNLKDKNYESNLADSLFCNDRQLGRDYPGAPTTGDGWDGPASGGALPGIQWTTTYYAAIFRNTSPTFKCTQQNDRFTVNDKNIGNGDLTYPVALITMDEVLYSGLISKNSSDPQYQNIALQYLKGGSFAMYWTMTPASLSIYQSIGTGASASMCMTTSPPSFNIPRCVMQVRPVINLKPTTMVLGDGSTSNPFVVG